MTAIQQKKLKWKPEDDILAFYLYRIKFAGEDDEDITLDNVAEFMSFSDSEDGGPEKRISSLKLRMSNFHFLSGRNGGLGNYSQLSKEVYDEYKGTDIDTHRKKCLEILNLQKNGKWRNESATGQSTAEN